MNIVIAVAHQLELDPFKAKFSVEESYNNGHGKVYLLETGHSAVRLVRTGIGMENARKSMGNTLKQLSDDDIRPDLLINFGTSGAIHPDRTVEDLVVGTEAASNGGDTIALDTIWSDHCIEYLVTLKRPYFRGPIYSTDKAVTDEQQRRTIYRETTAQVVDMECFSLAEVAGEYAIPFISMKYVSDNADEFAIKDFMANLEDATHDLSDLMYGFLEYLQEHKSRLLA
ncbi:MAG: 5'-methylthioadenosine/S-adenosylhomocysteine nucleosidase [Candidatus Marinimicrobia bacterium]|nr:5'-methylthioadenosine/S-adenosylhomocysteine nucleosidase [Candidatus Neomarinimicrobiota bacterium]MCF7827960.1 5'-methylthioadenosine/S-adenosylhomocysteine nucleosidase [Candidatus Neomarinimicrobiota bacterium]MCF7879285.1 5'-methylthioadenosine/S-adenosylhomocysteine nucleosidase [Candidatus Neomarinimicrobiota bacterium]